MLRQASRGLRLVRSHAEAWGVIPDQVAVLGFSAGGHLAGSISVLHHKFRFEQQDDLAEVSNRPDATILCYPVISSVRFHDRSAFPCS